MTVLDNARLRAQFPAASTMLYLDAAHQTPLSVAVRARLDAFYDEALHVAGPKSVWLRRVEQVRAKLAGFLGVTEHQLAFTKNTSEGLNIAAHGLTWQRGDNVVLLEGEHPNNAYAWLSQRDRGLRVKLVPQDKAFADADTFAPHLDTGTRAIAISHVMFHNGQRNDLASIAGLATRRGVPLVVDAMQSLGVVDIDLGSLGATVVAAGSHKGLLTPHGLGVLYTARGAAELPPTYVGTAGIANARADLVAGLDPIRLWESARRFEIGNVNLPAIHALGGALDLLTGIGAGAIEEHVLSLGDRLIEHLDDLGISLVGPREREHRSHIYVLALTAPGWAELFGNEGVRLSSVRSGIRVSFGLYNNVDDVERLARILRRGRAEIGQLVT